MKTYRGILFVAFGIARVCGAADAVPVADFARHAQYRWVEISPNGEHLALLARVDGHSTLELLHLADLKGLRLQGHNRTEASNFEWVGPDRLIYSVGEHVGGEDRPVPNGELFSFNADGSASRLLYGYGVGDQGVGSLIAPLPDDQNHALIESVEFKGGNGTLAYGGAAAEAYRIDLRNGSKHIVATSPMHVFDAGDTHFMTDHSGKIRFAYGEDAEQNFEVFYRSETSEAWTKVYPDGDAQKFEPLMFDRDNASVYARCAGENHIGGICRWDSKTRALSTLWSAKESGTAHLLKTFDGQDAFAIRTMRGRPSVVLIDKTSSEAKLLVQLMHDFIGHDVFFTSASRDGSKVVVRVSSDIDPGKFYLYDTNDKKISLIATAEPWVKPAQMAAMQPIDFKARDGLAIHGYLTRPPGLEEAKNLPLVVYVHGGPYGVHDTWGFDDTAQLLANRGYAVLQVNYRGSGGYGDEFERAGHREWGGKMQDDVTDATRWAIAQGAADPKRICIYGASYGGYAALEGAVKEPDLYKCAIGEVGVYDLRLMFTRGDIPQSAYGANYLKTVLGEDQADLWNRSPIAHLDRLKAHVMLIAGGADRRVPAVQGENLHNELDRRKIPHEWIYERTEGHGFYDEKHQADLYEKVLAFLDANIGAGGIDKGGVDKSSGIDKSIPDKNSNIDKSRADKPGDAKSSHAPNTAGTP